MHKINNIHLKIHRRRLYRDTINFHNNFIFPPKIYRRNNLKISTNKTTVIVHNKTRTDEHRTKILSKASSEEYSRYTSIRFNIDLAKLQKQQGNEFDIIKLRVLMEGKALMHP